MKNKVLTFCLKNNLIEKNDNIVVALSGGADSVSLFHFLLEIKNEYNLTVYAAHLNHMIRGKDADEDMKFVESLCKENDVRLFLKSVDVKELSKNRNQSEELTGRIERYKFFSYLNKTLNAKVATAHTSSDNVETIIYNIARGTSLKGACGIPFKRDYLIRPLLTVSREEIEEYCNINNFSYVNDKTNFDDDYTRNKIRHNIVPVLKNINNDLENTFLRFSCNNKEVFEYLEKTAEKELALCKTRYGYSVKKLLSLDKVILKYALMKIITDSGATFENRHIDLIIKSLSDESVVDLPSGYVVYSKQGIFRISNKTNKKIINKTIEECENIKIVDLEDFSKYDSNNLIDYEKLGKNTIIRHRKPGDVFSLKNRKVTKSLKKLLNEEKIPCEIRDSLLVVANGDDVLWCEILGASEHGKISKNSAKAVYITGDLK